MATTLDIPPYAAGDNILNSLNQNSELVEAIVNNPDGANVQSGTLPTTALQAKKAVFPVTLQWEAGVGAFGGVKAEFKLPNVDGASSSNWRFTGYSICAQTATTPAGTIDLRKNATTMLAGAFDCATLVAGTGQVGYPAAAVACASADAIDVIFAGMGGTIADVTLILWFSQQHVST